MKTKQFDDPVYKVKVTAIYATGDELVGWNTKSGILLDDIEGFDGAHYLDKDDNHVIWMRNRKDFYSLLHECVHLVRAIFEQRGISCDLTKEDEHFAYYQNYWFVCLWKFFGNVGKKRG